MKKHLTLVLSFLFLLTACANNYIPEAKVTFKVVDMHGNPISNEDAALGFSPAIGFHGKTDEHGYFTGRGRTESDYVFSVAHESNKYYRTHFSKQIANWKDYPKDGKWKPWNETIEVVVKEKINPIPMYAINFSNFKSNIPDLDRWIGYDLEKNDWISPYGNGVVADVEYCLSLTYCQKQYIQQSLKVRFPYDDAGCYFMKKDTNCAIPSTYHANVNRSYQREVTFTKTHLLTSAQVQFSPKDSFMLKKDDYLIFRTRTKVDENGNLIEARYGKIYGPIEFNFVLNPIGEIMQKSIQMSYHFNPNVNDPNLECNGTSLIKGVRRVAP